MPLPVSADPMPDVAAPLAREGLRFIAVDLRVEAGDWPSPSHLRSLARRIVDAAAASISPLPRSGELSLLFTDDAHIRVLNRHYRAIDKPTNVLAFPSAAPADGRSGMILGDVVIASETLRREARSQDLTIEAHLAHLILHGFLHILGYDHTDEAEALAMERLETAILGDLGIADPHAGNI